MSSRTDSTGFIGGGNMARAIIGGLLSGGRDPASIRVSDPNAEQRQALEQLDARLGITDDNSEVAANADALLLAVKPQLMADVCAGLAGIRRPAGQLVISIAAGIRITTLEHCLGAGTPVVRVMPNQPALVGAGMSVLVANAAVNDVQRALADNIACAVGQTAWIDDEELLDAVTAISGSGPAYFYLLMETMVDCAMAMGLSPALADTLVRQTALGAARSAGQTGADIRELRQSVTSPGGTTHAAVTSLEDAGIRDIFRRALEAARDRSVELGKPGDQAG